MGSPYAYRVNLAEHDGVEARPLRTNASVVVLSSVAGHLDG